MSVIARTNLGVVAASGAVSWFGSIVARSELRAAGISLASQLAPFGVVVGVTIVGALLHRAVGSPGIHPRWAPLAGRADFLVCVCGASAALAMAACAGVHIAVPLFLVRVVNLCGASGWIASVALWGRVQRARRLEGEQRSV